MYIKHKPTTPTPKARRFPVIKPVTTEFYRAPIISHHGLSRTELRKIIIDLIG
jgi:hypothetical protein